MGSAGAAFQYTFRRQHKSLAKSVTLEGDQAIFRASGNEPARRRKQGRDGGPIEHDQSESYQGRQPLSERRYSFHLRIPPQTRRGAAMRLHKSAELSRREPRKETV